MGLTSALNTSLNGLSLNETAIDVLGNNIANAGTIGFKASKVLFATQLARTLSYGSRPTATDGGTNPRQIGLGASVTAITPDFSQGSISASSSPSDLAIQGDGFFILNSITDGQVYTRNGNFRLDSGDSLSNSQGQRLLGYGVDTNFNLITTTLTSLKIPLGSLHLAQQTSNVVMSGALSPQGVVATRGTLQTSEALADAGNGNAAAVGTTLLTDLQRNAALGTPLFSLNDVVNFSPIKGGRTLETKSFTVTAASTLADLTNFMRGTIGIQTGGSIPTDADAIAAGISIVGGQLLVKGNRGTVNDFDLPPGVMTINNTAVPISFTASPNRANGESTVTAFTVYDSLGTALTVRTSAYLETQSSGNTVYRYLIESADQSGNSIVIGNSTVAFDSVGKVSAGTTSQFSIDRSTSSAINPMIVTVDMSQMSGISSTGSNLNLFSQDGTSPGTLTSYVIDEKGVINGAFDNGIIRTLGQVVLARFSNPSGLLSNGFDNYTEGIASGLPQLSAPGSFGAGSIRAGSLELSNTDIGKNLVDLIVASTNYRGNARVISSVDQLVNELLVLGRG
jgi:flagellar hook protein FlgE